MAVRREVRGVSRRRWARISRRTSSLSDRRDREVGVRGRKQGKKEGEDLRQVAMGVGRQIAFRASVPVFLPYRLLASSYGIVLFFEMDL